ncbi:MAG: DM13 domain-containing protein [Ferruginibacter sp.]
MKYIIAFAFLVFTSTSCKKEGKTVIEPLPQGTTLVSGNFTSSAHTTSGTAKIIRDDSNNLKLVFENFKTDNGPDLRVWMSSNTMANGYIEIGTLRAVAGNFSYDVGAQTDYTTNKNLLIWCEDAAVLFGYAVLQ